MEYRRVTYSIAMRLCTISVGTEIKSINCIVFPIHRHLP